MAFLHVVSTLYWYHYIPVTAISVYLSLSLVAPIAFISLKPRHIELKHILMFRNSIIVTSKLSKPPLPFQCWRLAKNIQVSVCFKCFVNISLRRGGAKYVKTKMFQQINWRGLNGNEMEWLDASILFGEIGFELKRWTNFLIRFLVLLAIRYQCQKINRWPILA